MVLPELTPRVARSNPNKHPQESAMTKLIPLLERFGLFAPKQDSADLFDLRLMRIGTREARARNQCQTFKNRPSRSADAKTS